MGRNVISAKLDIIFKKLFSENLDLLHEFVADMLDIPSESIKEIKITNPEIPPETMEGKFSRLDLSLNVDDKLVNVEIQIKNDNDYRDRTLFYWAKLYTSELKSGEPYGNLKQTITINIINFNMFDEPDYHTEVVAEIKGTQKIFSEKFSIHFFELKKVGKIPNSKNRKELWLQFLNAGSEEEFEMLKQTEIPTIEKAVRLIYDMSEDARLREIAWMREKSLHDEASALLNAENKGIAKGIIKGRAEGISEGVSKMVENMRKNGIPEEQIQKILDDMK